MHERLGSELVKVVAQRGQAVLGGGRAEGLKGVWIDLAGGESVGGRDVREAEQGVHDGQFAAGGPVSDRRPVCRWAILWAGASW